MAQTRNTKKPGHGTLVVCDVVAFSEKGEDEQVACVCFLDKAFRRAIKVLALQPEPYVNCTGDGFLAVLGMTSPESDSAIEASLRLCTAILKDCKKFNRTKSNRTKRWSPLLVRFGVHKDDFPPEVNAFKASHIIGSAPNLTARVASVGDGSHVVVSEDFYAYAVRAHPDWKRRFTKVAEVSVKHNRLVSVRVYLGHPSQRGLFNDKTPRRVRIMEMLDARIGKTIESLGEALASALGIPKRQIRPRLSVFLPDRNEEKLVCTSYRWHWLNRRRTRGPTEYTLDPPVGPLAHAFVTGQAAIVNDLPDPSDGIEAYADAWLNGRHGRWNLTKRHIVGENGEGGWSRFPQAILAIPFRLPRKATAVLPPPAETTAGTHPVQAVEAGVLCVDTEHPLSEDVVSRAQLQGIVQGIEQQIAEVMAWFLLARRLA